MNRANRGAMTNIRHIIYDILGNVVVYVICRMVFVLFFQRNDISANNTLTAAILYLFIYILVSKDRKLYDVTTFYYADRVIKNVLLGCMIATFAVSTTFYFSGRAQSNRVFYMVYFVLSFITLLLTAYLSFHTNQKRLSAMRTLMIGSKRNFRRFRSYIKKTNVSFASVGYVKLERDNTLDDGDNSYLGFVTDGDLEHILREKVVDQVYIMQESENSAAVQTAIDICVQLGIVTRVVLPTLCKDCPGYISSVGTYPVMSYHLNSLNTTDQAFKRVIDIFGALVGIILSAPILAIAAAAIKIDSPGPVFFSQIRVGRNGRRFRIMKLRTMTTDAEVRKSELMALNEVSGGLMFKIKEDPRITKVGAFLRKTSIDEIPQFFNVLAGNMSLVGTRPPTEDEVELYDLNHWRRLRIKPGITGLWQISGRSALTSFDEIVELDTRYIEHWSILSDIRIILRTVLVVLKRKGAY